MGCLLSHDILRINDITRVKMSKGDYRLLLSKSSRTTYLFIRGFGADNKNNR